MKTLILSLLFTFSFQSHGEADFKAQAFSKMKEMAFKNIESNIGLLNELKSCITKAKEKKSIKSCHEVTKEKRMELIVKGHEQQKKYSWDRSGEKLWSLFQKVVNN